jgi:hypothetical protein
MTPIKKEKKLCLSSLPRKVTKSERRRKNRDFFIKMFLSCLLYASAASNEPTRSPETILHLENNTGAGEGSSQE